MDRKELVRNLIIMAASDGSLTERELRLLSDRCQEWGVTEHEFAKILESSLEEKSKLNLPTSRALREELLVELVHMMAADGRLVESEKRLFAMVAVAMDFAHDEIQAIIDRALEVDS